MQSNVSKEIEDWTTWPLEKLQAEYRELKAENSFLKRHIASALEAEREVEELANRFSKFINCGRDDV